MVPYAHWRICPYCDPEFVESITARWAPVLELKDKGLPSRPGG